MGRIVTLKGDETDEGLVREVAALMLAGGVSVFPTDTVYGIAQAVAANPFGATRLFQIKRRPLEKTIPWLVGSPSDLDRYGADVPEYAHALARAWWPGGLTIVVRAGEEVPRAYRAADGTVALRVPDAPFVRMLARACGGALATTSANTSGLPAPTCPEQIEARIIEEVGITVEAAAPTAQRMSSTVVDCSRSHDPRQMVVMREGAISQAQLASTALI